jgi:glutamate racemase
LQAQGIKLLVVACNTASAVALDQLRDALSPLPVIGVVEPGADAAVGARRQASHLVLATEATVRLGAYRHAIAARDPDANVREHACEMLVSLAEEGWLDGDIASAIIRRYLEDATGGGFVADTIILGCTHFPLLINAIRAVVADNVVLIDSASTTAGVVRETLTGAGQLCDSDEQGATRFLATDGVRRFASVGSRFLGRSLSPDDVELVDL